MSIKLRVLCIAAALCFLGSIACFSGYASEVLAQPSGDEEYVEPTVPEPTVPEPVNPEPVDPAPVDPEPVDPEPVVSDPVYSEPGYEDPSNTESSFEEPYDPSSEYMPEYSEVTSDGNYSQTDVSSYIDYASQYIAYTYSATYDDNYYYVPSYTEPTQSLIDISSKEVDTDELSSDDWKNIILDLEQGNITDGTKTFNFIKNNETEGDTSIDWMLYLGMGLIVLAIIIVIYVIISTQKANRLVKKYRAV